MSICNESMASNRPYFVVETIVLLTLKISVNKVNNNVYIIRYAQSNNNGTESSCLLTA